MVDYTKAITAEKNFEKLLFSFERFAENSLGCAINGHREARSSVQELNCCLVSETHSRSDGLVMLKKTLCTKCLIFQVERIQ